MWVCTWRRETRKEKKERARVAETVLVARLEEVPRDVKKSKSKENTAGWSKGGELMYEYVLFSLLFLHG